MRGSRSLNGLVGDRDDFLVDERGDRSGVLELGLVSLSDFFLGEDLEKKAGNTMEMTMAPGNEFLGGKERAYEVALSLLCVFLCSFWFWCESGLDGQLRGADA